MKKRRVKSAARPGPGRGQKQPKGRLGRKPDEDAIGFGGSDVDSDEFYHDEIDDFHADQEKMLLGDDTGFKANLSSEEEEEIMPITDDDEDDDLAEEAEEELEDEGDQGSFHKSDMESDLEDKSDEDGLPSLSAWGKKKYMYYGADFVDKDRGKSYRPEDEEKAVAEEEAGNEVYRNVNTDLGPKSLKLRDFEDGQEEEEEELEALDKNVTDLSKDDHKKYLEKHSPEFFLLVDDFEKLMTELIERVSPLLELVKDGRIKGEGARYLSAKSTLIRLYCMNICFYMMLKANSTPVKYHPVMKRLSQFKKYINELEETDKKLKPEIDFMLEKLKNGENIKFISDAENENEDESLLVDRNASDKQETLKRHIEEDMSEVLQKSKKQKVKKTTDPFKTEVKQDAKLLLSSDDDDPQDEDELQDEEYDLNESRDIEEFGNGDEEMTEGGKRSITYEIAKNKGLLPYRKKEYRNPRVRNRMKYRRAKIRRKGQVREPRKEITRYGGELTGIRTNVAKSIKLK